ncbi:DUF2334 domain-containing protein [Pseudonocardia acidicola]|uniref:DUF2334 domain-containing protein n=1 Tax=Pseudonocardia acidicola TaxID=2724939 RepID=A0ABX1SDU3_9PSEU|nr:DUF2334 domain-containing protein [Pseudonocardia acidicola]NMH98667.1 DUF2334 domain-containing protein [Pseudonocardia acidicola]
MAARLVVSLSGLSDEAPEALARGSELTAELDARGVPLSQLFRPRGRDGVVGPGSPLVRWLHERRAAGDAIVLHGYDHTAAPIGSWRSVPQLGRRAEFAALPRHEAALRLMAARRALTGAGLVTDLFVPPRWLASPGTLEALREQGFVVCADESAVRLLHGPQAGTAVRARVLGFRASGEKRPVAEDQRAAEAWRCRVLGGEALRTARRGGLVRIALRAKDLKRPARVRAALAAVDAVLALGAVPATYAPAGATRAA